MDGKENDTAVTITKTELDSKVNEKAENITKDLVLQVEKLEKELDVVKRSINPNPASYHISTNEEMKNMGGTLMRAYIKSIIEGVDVKSVFNEWREKYNDSRIARFEKSMTEKTMTGNVNSAGGFYIPEDLSPEIIPLLYANSLFRANGARVEPMSDGNRTIRKNTDGTAWYWEDEITTATPKDMGVGVIKLNAKKMSGFLERSNDLFRRADINLDSQIMEDMGLSKSLKEDTAFLDGTGNLFQPLGLKGWINTEPAATRNSHAQAGTTTALMQQSLTTAINDIAVGLKGNMAVANLKWLMSFQTYFALCNAREATSGIQPAWSRSLELNKTMYGFPVIVSSICPVTEMYLISFKYFVILDTMKLNIEVFPNGTITVGNTTFSGITRDTTIFRGLSEVECYSQFSRAHSIITGLTWA